MTQIRNYAIERLASTIYDDDLLDIQIMEAGADQYEEARMKVSELRKLMNDGSTPLRYKAIIDFTYESYTSGTLTIGKEYVISVLEAGDDFSNVGYVSDKATFIATGTTPTTWTNSTEVINVSSSIADVLGVGVDTLVPTISYGFNFDDYIVYFEKTGMFLNDKTYYGTLSRQDDDFLYAILSSYEGRKEVLIEVYP